MGAAIVSINLGKFTAVDGAHPMHRLGIRPIVSARARAVSLTGSVVSLTPSDALSDFRRVFPVGEGSCGLFFSAPEHTAHARLSPQGQQFGLHPASPAA